ncbi:MAG: flagellar hook assembly protein FlgD [Mizugakiibacter sp.]|uniref:flagellar hook assembly protein FlgD n=1 Tax=Mizugakiibacter sp. TaxID=1972610 RepID=UPI0031C486DE|nr:flagellar hook assembly protein FlgD [Xanthomonadaceae bacterium]
MNAIGNSLNTAMATSSGSGSRDQLGQSDFLKLMIEQFRNQDPTKPMESGEFMSQLAQFSTVSGIQGLQTSFNALAASLQADQALRAADLVGHRVMVPGSTANLAAGGTVGGGVDVQAGGTVVVKITDASGQLVRSLNLGERPAGLAQFAWDGKADDGTPMPAGNYAVSAQVWSGGASQAAGTYVVGAVSGVSVGATGAAPTLQVDGVGATTLDQVKQIM